MLQQNKVPKWLIALLMWAGLMIPVKKGYIAIEYGIGMVISFMWACDFVMD